MHRSFWWILLSAAALMILAPAARAANQVAIQTTDAYIAERGVRLDVYAHNEVGLLEYFDLIVFDASRLEFAGIAADRGGIWYGYYPTYVSNDSIFIHGVASGSPYCIDPDLGIPGSPLYHLTFDVKAGASPGTATVRFGSQFPFDGHWNDCSGYQVSPGPLHADGSVTVLGHANHVTVGSDSAGAGNPAVVDVSLHNDLDVFEYFHRVLFESPVASVDSIVAVRGALSYGNYPTGVDGDTVFVHGWAAGDGCFPEDHSSPGAPLYRIHFSLDPAAPPGHVMPLAFIEEGLTWNHWVGCDLVTTDLFTATDGSVTVMATTGVETPRPVTATARLAPAAPNPCRGPSSIRFYLPEPGFATLAVHDLQGRLVRTLRSGDQPAGWQEVRWDGVDAEGRPVAAGVYFFRLRTEDGGLTRRLVRIE